jgi:hypothetical protein
METDAKQATGTVARHREARYRSLLGLFLGISAAHQTANGSITVCCMRQRKQAGIFSTSKASFLSIDMSNADTIELPEEGGVRMPLPKFAMSGESASNVPLTKRTVHTVSSAA